MDACGDFFFNTFNAEVPVALAEQLIFEVKEAIKIRVPERWLRLKKPMSAIAIFRQLTGMTEPVLSREVNFSNFS